MLWFYLAIASTVIFAAQELLMKVLSVKTGSPRIFSVIFNLWGAAFALILFIVQNGSFISITTLSFPQIALVLAMILLYGLYERYQFSARQVVDAGTFSIIMRLQTAIGFIGAILFLHEPATISKISGVLLILMASLLLIYKNPKLVLSKALGLAIFCSVLLGITGFLDKPASAALPATLYSFILWSIPLFIVAFPKITKKEIVKELHIGGWKVALAALLNVTGYIIYIQAISLTDISRVNPIVATNSILTIIGGIIFLHERDHLWRKIAAGIIAFLGVILLK